MRLAAACEAGDARDRLDALVLSGDQGDADAPGARIAPGRVAPEEAAGQHQTFCSANNCTREGRVVVGRAAHR